MAARKPPKQTTWSFSTLSWRGHKPDLACILRPLSIPAVAFSPRRLASPAIPVLRPCLATAGSCASFPPVSIHRPPPSRLRPRGCTGAEERERSWARS
eukprot:scaffold3620_cov417-Prasinococcus_capsulatus_cf.AAC.6